MKILLTQPESLAIGKLRGLPDDAHWLLMCSRLTDDGEVLDGSEEAFRELIEFIDEELSEGMLTRRSATVLADLCVRIDPSCADWLGA